MHVTRIEEAKAYESKQDKDMIARRPRSKEASPATIEADMEAAHEQRRALAALPPVIDQELLAWAFLVPLDGL